MYCVGALALSLRVSPRDIGLLVFFGSAFYLITGLAAELYFGRFMPLWAGYRFSGTQIANLQAINCSFLVISGLVCGDSSKTYKKVFYWGALVGLLFLGLTKSRASFVAMIIAVIVYKIMVLKPSRRSTVAYVIFLVLSVSFLIFGESAVSSLGQGVNLGRSTEGIATLNGRIWLWEECRGYAGQRKLQGYGFNGFWTPERVETISESQGWALASSHSVYFDVLLELGLVGVVAFVFLLIGSILRSGRIFEKTGGFGSAFFFCFLVFYLSNGILESVLIHPGFYSFISMVVLASLVFSGPVVRGGTEERGS